MTLGIIADDVTGASDIGLTLAEAGLRVTQFVGVPPGAPPAVTETGVISLNSRTATEAEAVAQSLAACEWLLAQGAQQIVLKVCSTFPENGRSVYQGHLFAGGETSGAVVAALDASALDIGPRIAAGVPLLRVPRPGPVALALKSDNFGDETFFDKPCAGWKPTMTEPTRLRGDLSRIAKSLVDHGLTAGAAGNISARPPVGSVLMNVKKGNA